jgi:hypothetical protein
LFLQFFPDKGHLSKRFAHNVGEGERSMADLQKVLLDNRNDPSKAIIAVEKRLVA